jgi:hypothetical protein
MLCVQDNINSICNPLQSTLQVGCFYRIYLQLVRITFNLIVPPIIIFSMVFLKIY